jgi:acetyl-CoA synthetase
MMRTVFGDHQRFIDTYFKTYPGMYFTGDGAKRDEDGYYWITGRVDDVTERLRPSDGYGRNRSSLVLHEAGRRSGGGRLPARYQGAGHLCLCDADRGRGSGRCAAQELVKWVRSEIGPIAGIDKLQFAPGLPKTRSGKIMRRILRKIAENEIDRPRRHLHAGRSVRRRRAGGRPTVMSGRRRRDPDRSTWEPHRWRPPRSA